MDLGSLLLALALILIVAALVARPIMEQAAHRTPDTLPASGDDLITQRESILIELRDLDFDHSTGKVSDDDYQIQRARLVAKGAEVLRALDEIPISNLQSPISRSSATSPDAEIEALVAARRARKAKPAAGSFCPQCGKGVIAGDKFCPHCGAKLSLPETAR